MSLKTREVKSSQTFYVCDLCGNEVNANNGNTIHVGSGDDVVEYHVHGNGEIRPTDTCLTKLVQEAIEARRGAKTPPKPK